MGEVSRYFTEDQMWGLSLTSFAFCQGFAIVQSGPALWHAFCSHFSLLSVPPLLRTPPYKTPANSLSHMPLLLGGLL